MDEQQKRIATNLLGITLFASTIAQWVFGVGWLTVLTAVSLTLFGAYLHYMQQIGTPATYLLALLTQTPMIDTLSQPLLAWLRAISLLLLALLLLEYPLKGAWRIMAQYTLAGLTLFYAGLMLAPAFATPVWAWVLLLTISVLAFAGWQYFHLNRWQEGA